MKVNMFSWMNEEGGLSLRMSKEDRKAFIEKYDTELHKAYGVVIRPYVSVPGTMLKKTAELKKYFAASVAYAKTLKPKQTTRKAAKKAAKKW